MRGTIRKSIRRMGNVVQGEKARNTEGARQRKQTRRKKKTKGTMMRCKKRSMQKGWGVLAGNDLELEGRLCVVAGLAQGLEVREPKDVYEGGLVGIDP